ncbi:MAG: major capsid protein [Sulfuricellaceae bacterium]
MSRLTIKHGRELLLQSRSKVVAALAASTAFVAVQAQAALDTTAVQTSLTGAQTTGETVGGYVIALVAGLVVVGLVIGLIKKA